MLRSYCKQDALVVALDGGNWITSAPKASAASG